ncbi:MAG: Soluble lytic murein transglycosylase [Deltaproteobacteria bacterium]|jgi:tetratricopeptide (TPR) repeat protein|nr:Soluble lytic murein transglycosylase [Deltaproteobacteria bacterium]
MAAANALIFLLLFSFSSVYAHRIPSWEPYYNSYQKGECKQLLQRLKPLSKPKAWVNNGLWSRSQIIKSKCHQQLGNHKEALKNIKITPDSEMKDVWLFQKIRFLLQTAKHREAIAGIRELLRHPKRNFYLASIREELKKVFRTDKEVHIIYHLLHDTRKTKDWFLMDYELHSLYLRGAELHDHKIERKYKVLGWQYPIDEKSALLTHKNLTALDLKIMSTKEVFNRVRTLERLGLDMYLMKHLPQLRKGRSKELVHKLGKSYLSALFAEKYYSRIIKFHQQSKLSKVWFLPKETQLKWTALSYIKRRNIPAGRSTIYKLERLNSKSRHLPKLYDTFATRYMLDSEIKKAQFWWDRLLTKFPAHSLSIKSVWQLAWTHKQNKNTHKALYYLKKGLKKRIYDSEMKAKLLYWQGKFLQEKGHTELAEKSFKRLILQKPNTYYGMRLLSDKDVPESIMSVVKTRNAKLYAKPVKSVDKNTKELIKRTEFLFDIDEPEQALREIFAGLGKYKDSTRNWHVSHLLHRRGEYYSLLRIVANYYLPHLITHEVGEHPLWELAYPRPYWSQLKSYANQAGIDPYFALAIMREESHFDPKALSSSKAMGLMQLMPKTAKYVAKKKKIKLREKDDIFNPELNTRLGTLYLGGLSDRFKSELIYTAGSYNAGPHNMIKWIKRWKGKPLDAFVEQIPFNETKNYVKRVYRSYKLYKQIYSS